MLRYSNISLVIIKGMEDNTAKRENLCDGRVLKVCERELENNNKPLHH
jgi:hypothetical protein